MTFGESRRSFPRRSSHSLSFCLQQVLSDWVCSPQTVPIGLGESGLRFHLSAGCIHPCRARGLYGSGSTSSDFFFQEELTSFEVVHTPLDHVFPSEFVTVVGSVQYILRTSEVVRYF